MPNHNRTARPPPTIPDGVHLAGPNTHQQPRAFSDGPIKTGLRARARMCGGAARRAAPSARRAVPVARDKWAAARRAGASAPHKSTTARDESTTAPHKSTSAWDESTSARRKSTPPRHGSTTVWRKSTSARDESTTSLGVWGGTRGLESPPHCNHGGHAGWKARPPEIMAMQSQGHGTRHPTPGVRHQTSSTKHPATGVNHGLPKGAGRPAERTGRRSERLGGRDAHPTAAGPIRTTGCAVLEGQRHL